jgi:lipoprotein-anchoring transpeptidase ErfK/SrfK
MIISHPSITLSKAATLAAGVAMFAGLLSGCSTLANLQTRMQGQGAAPKDAPAVVAQPVKPEPLPNPEPAKKTKLYEWTGEGRAVTRVVVNVDEQRAHFYEGDKEVGWTTVASGVSKFPTPVGSFSVQEKVANKESNLYGRIYGKGGQLINSNAKVGKTPIPEGARFDGADMPYFLRLTGDGIGMHAGPIPNPGRPASHGCIRMPKAFAPIAFRHVGVGTQVSIVGKGPSYSAYLAQQRASAPRPKPAAQAPAQPPAQPSVGAAETMAQAATAVLASDGVVPGPTSAEPLGPSAVLAAPQGVPAPAQSSPPIATVAPDAPKVPAVAHNPEPPVAPAIATRTEPTQTLVATVPNAAKELLQAPVSGQTPAPVVAQTPVAVSAPGVTRAETLPAPGAKPVSGPAHAAQTPSTPAAPTAVYYPTPRVPAYRAPVQGPVLLPPQAAPVAAQTTAPAQTAAAAQPKAPEQPVAAAKPQAAESKAPAQPAAVQPKAPEQPAAAAQPATPAQPAATQTQGAG